MSLTFFVPEAEGPVVVVRWFLETKGLVIFACVPALQMNFHEFRTIGHEWVRRHFEEYLKVRVPRSQMVKPFQPGEAKKLMKGRARFR